MSGFSDLVSEGHLFREPMNAARIMTGFPHPWCVCGGWAIALFTNQVFRHHKDIDIAIWRTDQLALHSHLNAQGWTLEKASDGQLFPWKNEEFLELPIHTIWCNNPSVQPSFIEILLNEIDDQSFRFRRALSITYPLTNTIVTSDVGIPILAPEIVLLYKAKTYSDQHHRADFEATLPYLNRDRCAWLKQALTKLYPDHDWLMYFEDAVGLPEQTPT